MTEIQKITVALRRKGLSSDQRNVLTRRKNELLTMRAYVREADYDARQSQRRKNPTKAQKREKARKASVQRRVATALANFLKKANPAMKTTGARITKLKGGGFNIRPIKAKRGKR